MVHLWPGTSLAPMTSAALQVARTPEVGAVTAHPSCGLGDRTRTMPNETERNASRTMTAASHAAERSRSQARRKTFGARAAAKVAVGIFVASVCLEDSSWRNDDRSPFFVFRSSSGL